MSESLAYLEPLKAEMQKVESEIEEAEERLRELRKKRTGLGRGLAALDPRWSANNSKRKPRVSRSVSSAETRDRVMAFLREHYADSEFSGPKLLNAGLELSKPYLAQTLNDLQTDGRIRLDHIGEGGTQKRTKVYRLIVADA